MVVILLDIKEVTLLWGFLNTEDLVFESFKKKDKAHYLAWNTKIIYFS